MEILPPREHCVDETASERMFAYLGTSRPVSIEIGAEATGIRFLLRGGTSVVSRAQQQMQTTYAQARFRQVSPEEDPARMDGTPFATAKLRLRKTCLLPLVTFREGDFAAGDPLRGLLGVFSHLQEGERLLAQLVLTPAPRGWADQFSGFMRPSSSNLSGEPPSLPLLGRQALSLGSFFLWLLLTLCALTGWVSKHWFEFVAFAILSVIALAWMVYLFLLALERLNLNAELVQKKIQSLSFDVSLRLVAFAPTYERARELLHDLSMAYRQYDLASGNGLEGRIAEFDPRVVEGEHTSRWNEFRARANRLNVAELAGMWHLPLDPDVPLVERTQAKRLLPLPQTVKEGVLIGHSDHQGHRVPVHLSQEALWGNCFMVAKT